MNADGSSHIQLDVKTSDLMVSNQKKQTEVTIKQPN